MKESESENTSSNYKKNVTPSSLKNNKFKGMTAEQIIKKYEDVLISREKQFFELSQEIGDVTQKIQNLKQKREKSIYNNTLLKEIYTKKDQLLKQELSNKELLFMTLTDLDHKYDDLQNKIEYIINKQNALADLNQREREKMNQDKEEVKTLIDKDAYEENEMSNQDTEVTKESNNKDENEDKEENNKNIINDDSNQLIIENNKLSDINENKKKEDDEEKEIKSKKVIPEKKENSFSLARERLNRLKKDKNEKIKKLDLSEFLNQPDNK